MTDRKKTHVLLAILAVVATLYALKWTSSVTMPLAVSAFIVILAAPLQRYLQDHLHRSIAFSLTILAVFAVAAAFFAVLSLCADRVIDGSDKYARHLSNLGTGLQSWAESRGIPLDLGNIQSSDVATSAQAAVKKVAKLGIAAVGGAVLIIAFTVLGIFEAGTWRSKISSAFGDHGKRALTVAANVTGRFRSYALTRTLTSAITGVLSGLFTWIIGLDFPIVWGVSSFLLNYIPTLGSIVAIIPPTLVAFLQFGGVWQPLAVPAGLGVIQLVLGTYVDPYLQGRNLELSPLVVLASIAFWGFVWGIPGALLGVPLTICIAVVCGQFATTRWIFTLLAKDPGADPTVA